MAGSMAFLPAAPTSTAALTASAWTASRGGGRPRLAVAAAAARRRRPTPSTPAAPTMSLLPLIPNWLLLGGWAFAAFKFAAGFEATTYEPKFKLPLAAAWPVLFVVNGKYRKNFQKALKGRD